MAMVDPQDARAERDREETQERNERKREQERQRESERRGFYERNSEKTGSSVFCTIFSHLQFESNRKKIDSKTRLIVASARKQYASCMWFSQQ
jgi:vacuolar-type H+-ATPase subunit E/Vma4